MKQKTLPFIALIVAIFCLWPQYKSPGQAPDHPTPAALDAKAQQIEKKISSSKAAIYDEIERIKNLPPKVVTIVLVRLVFFQDLLRSLVYSLNLFRSIYNGFYIDKLKKEQSDST